MAYIKEIDFGDGTVATITDWGPYDLWSRIRIEPANFGNQQVFFQYQSGQAAPGIQISTDIDTNMPSAGSLSAEQEMLIYSIQIVPDEIAGTAITDGESSYAAGSHVPEKTVTAAYAKWAGIFGSLLMQFRIEQAKTYAEGRIDHFPTGGGPVMNHNSQTDDQAAEAADWAASYHINNGTPQWPSARRLATPLYLNGLETFRAILWAPRGALNIATPIAWEFGAGFTCRLTGPRKRPTL
jgi:hypothetical protein